MRNSERTPDLFAWNPPTAALLCFPLSRRIDFVRRHAAIVAKLSMEAADIHLSRQLTRQASVLASKGISKTSIEREILELRKAVFDFAGRLSDGGEVVAR